MMDTITNAPRRFTLYAAILAVAALVITLMALTFATDPASAQSKTYPDPQPCGQGQAKVAENVANQITSGEIALFDAYWDIPTRTINNNLCPPEMLQTTQSDALGNETVTVTRSDAKIDIAKTVIHVTDDYKVAVVNSNAADYDPSAVSGPIIDVAEYPSLGKGLGLGENEAPEAGTEVYWLQLDDPDTVTEDETSDLVLGFSTALFESKYWEARGNNKPFYYEFESERDNIFEVHGPHFFAFDAPMAGDRPQKEAVWDTYEADFRQVQMDPGERRNLQWIFTEPGTHHIQVHVVGHVNETPSDPSDAWEENPPEEKTVTSEVRVYTIQTGPLHFNEQPMFQVERSVTENSPSGVKVGAPVPVAGGDDGDTLTYGLSGKGSSHFRVASEPGGGAQITVAPGALLDYETQPTYDLVLGVSDGKDHEGQRDPSVDSTVALEISLTDVTGDPTVTIQVDNASPTVGQTVTLTSSLSGDIPPPALIEYDWVERDLASDERVGLSDNNGWGVVSVSATHSTAGERTYQAHLSFAGFSAGELGSNIVSATWTDSP